MTEYTIDINGKRYSLNEDFRRSIQERAQEAYSDNRVFSCWWKVATRESYDEDDWIRNIHEKGDPVLVIETVGKIVPWERLDKLEATEIEEDDESVFGRTHFSQTPEEYDKVNSPDGDDEDKIPPMPDEIGDEPKMVIWPPKDPDVEHTWDTGEAVTEMTSWVEWNVQQKANQDAHDIYEAMCEYHDCEVVGEYEPSDQIPDDSGQVERKGQQAYDDGRYGGGHWNV